MLDKTLNEFLEALASASPTPGGGSASALCGAIGAALSRMMANLAIGKQGYEAQQEALARLNAEAKELQDKLASLVQEDAKAYDQVIAAISLPKSTDEQKAHRVEALRVALRKAAEVPMKVMELSLKSLEVAEEVAGKGNRNAITDIGVSALLSLAAMKGAALNVRINLASISDEAFRAQSEEHVDVLLKRGDEIARRIENLVHTNI